MFIAGQKGNGRVNKSVFVKLFVVGGDKFHF